MCKCVNVMYRCHHTDEFYSFHFGWIARECRSTKNSLLHINIHLNITVTTYGGVSKHRPGICTRKMLDRKKSNRHKQQQQQQQQRQERIHEITTATHPAHTVSPSSLIYRIAFLILCPLKWVSQASLLMLLLCTKRTFSVAFFMITKWKSRPASKKDKHTHCPKR